MTAREQLRRTVRYLEDRGVPEPRLDAELLLADALGVGREALYLDSGRRLKPAERERLEAGAVRRGRERIPIAYVLGSREFWSERFRVTPDVLIPRPETETLVEAALPLVRVSGARTALEVGVGSGAVTGALALECPELRLVGVDRSLEALRVARRNLASLGVARRVRLVCGDMGTALRGPFDLIVSNLPYVRTAELALLPPEVRCEPTLALDGGVDGLALVRRLIRAAPRLLVPGGWLALELGHDQAARVRNLVESAGASGVSTRLDLAGVERVLLARFPGR